MTPGTPKEQWEFFKKDCVPGAWRLAAFLAVYFASAVSGLFLPRVFGVPSSYPGSDPPWYFIRQDFFTGIGCLGGIIAMLAVLAKTWRRYTVTNWFVLMMVCVWMVPGLVTAIAIYLQCPEFFDYSHALSAWPTHKAYLRSGVKFYGFPFAIALAFVCVVQLRKRVRAGQM